jgi:spermidine synthase
MEWYFGFFFLSGFCSILYELVWLRLAMAQFGVTTALVSIVLSIFMAGLGLGSWGGYLARKYGDRLRLPPLRLYAVAELLIGCSALVVPLEFKLGRVLLEQFTRNISQSSPVYYLVAGVWLALSLIPWCACMGATIPLAMFSIRSDQRLESRRSFSFLYLANVFGAVAGALVPLLLIEAFGFSKVLRVGMLINPIIFLSAFALTLRGSSAKRSEDLSHAPLLGGEHKAESRSLWLLFATGLTSMGMEVVWIRQFTPYVGTFVYSFAQILALYLSATFLGSSIYRIWSRRHNEEATLVWLVVWFAALLPLPSADPTFKIANESRLFLGITAFSAILGFLTPMLADRWSAGDPDKAGTAYAVNVLGCILGPLLAGFGLVPWLGERRALILLALPWLFVGFPVTRRWKAHAQELITPRTFASYVIVIASLVVVFGTKSFERNLPKRNLLRDSTATVIAYGQGMQRSLLVNGVGMTVLTPVTKMMSALPLAFLDHAPQSALVICFGMGTTHRSMMSWGISVTAVELVPSVPRFFWYFHDDAAQVLGSPRSRVIIDDGRRFLARTSEQFDVIALDPPPPPEAAASSLLYSKEFYALARQRLRRGGILQQWLPGSADVATQASVARAVRESFPYVRSFIAHDRGLWGIHFLASQQPIPSRSAPELASRMPATAAADLVEWGPYASAEQQFRALLENEIPIERIISQAPDEPALQDDRPVNEYYLLRRFGPSRSQGQPNNMINGQGIRIN